MDEGRLGLHLREKTLLRRDFLIGGALAAGLESSGKVCIAAAQARDETRRPVDALSLKASRKFYNFATLDVFTSERFGGNQLAVFPNAVGLSAEQMTRITREFNYSEASFVFPPSDPRNTAKVRIFEGHGEIPFAGHPNVGTAFLLGTIASAFGRPIGDALTFEELGGLVSAELLRTSTGVVGARIKAPQRLQIRTKLDPELLAACVSLPRSDIVDANGFPVMASAGLPFALVEVSSVDALAKAKPDHAAFRRADALHRQSEVSFSVLMFARGGASPVALRTRMFAPLDGIEEESVTGSASAALGAYLTTIAPRRNADVHWSLTQGVEMGRASKIEVSVKISAGEIERVEVGGSCKLVTRGQLYV